VVVWFSIAKLYENLDTLVPTDSLNFNFDGGSKLYKGILVVKDLFPIDYVLL
jgi:hypothetical protein